MNNFENMTKNIDTLKEFIAKYEIVGSCDICENNGISCKGVNCTENLIKFLEMEIEDKRETDIDKADWLEYKSDLDELKIDICGVKTYGKINRLINHFKDWIKDKKTLTINQEKEILDMEEIYLESLSHLSKLKFIFDEVKKMK